MSTENKYQFKGTPAPWVVWDGLIHDTTYLCRHIAFMVDGAMPEDEIKANGALIAAAPELLQACIEVERIFDCMNIHALGEKEKLTYETLRAAINKALNIQD